MKKVFLVVALAGFVFAANAQVAQKDSKQKKGKAKTEQMVMKDHVCTAACKDGKHMYAHGEKGHVCSEACNMDMKHAKHGQKGHVCTADCMKM